MQVASDPEKREWSQTEEIKAQMGDTLFFNDYVAILENVTRTADVAGISLGENVKKRFFNRLQRKKKRLFTSRNRRIVTIWRKYGLTGVAFLTPLIFSPILGTIVATSFGEPWRRIFVYMFVSAVFWGVAFSLLIQQLGKAFF